MEDDQVEDQVEEDDGLQVAEEEGVSEDDGDVDVEAGDGHERRVIEEGQCFPHFVVSVEFACDPAQVLDGPSAEARDAFDQHHESVGDVDKVEEDREAEHDQLEIVHLPGHSARTVVVAFREAGDCQRGDDEEGDV